MKCALTDDQVVAITAKIGQKFNTYQFGNECKSDVGKDCGESFSPCGKRLSKFARENPNSMIQTNPDKAPAEWHYFNTPQTAMQKGTEPVRSGHWDMVKWMALPDFLEIKRVYDKVAGEGRIYFRIIETGIVMIVLDDCATGYVGFHAESDDNKHILKRGIPTELKVCQHYAAFQKWLPTVARKAAEERAVIPFIRAALCNRLLLPKMDDKWIFLNQEWRFHEGKRSDILAVKISSGQLGIIEAKPEKEKRDEALKQLHEYRDYWQRDVNELAPFFTNVINVMGKLYNNDWARNAKVSNAPAALFFAYPDTAGHLQVEGVE